MLDELASRAEAIRARNAVLESVPGSGYHDDDKDHAGRRNSPQARGLPRLGEHVVAFYGDRDVTFVGPDAAKVQAALRAWLDAHETADAAVFSSYTGTDRKLLVEIPKLSIPDQCSMPALTVWKDVWNDILVALHAQGIGLTGAPREG